MKRIDALVPVLFIISLVVIYFFWGCHLDLYVTILAGMIILVTGLTTYLQNKKIKELTSKEEQQ